MKRWLMQIAVLLAVLAVGGFLVAASGIVPIKASSGHWAITALVSALCHAAFRRHPHSGTGGAGARRAVARAERRRPLRDRLPSLPRQPGAPPPEDRAADDSRIRRTCRRGSPTWEPEELFYIVKHGIKFTGMPAWPAQQRDDEVWAMVAFLRTLPDLDAEEYRRLVHGEAAAQRGRGADPRPPGTGAGAPRGHRELRTLPRRGRPRPGTGRFPALAGQRPAYLWPPSRPMRAGSATAASWSRSPLA